MGVFYSFWKICSQLKRDVSVVDAEAGIVPQAHSFLVQ